MWRDQLHAGVVCRPAVSLRVDHRREGGQRAVTHEFPKKDLPYTETMGRRAMGFSIRGYFITFPFNTGQPLYQRDYRVPRDNLINVLDAGRPGVLQLPTQAPMWVVCTQYRVAEEQKAGGFLRDRNVVYRIRQDAKPGARCHGASARCRRQHDPTDVGDHGTGAAAMNRADIKEAAPIVLHMLKNLSGCVPPAGLAGSQARTAIGDTAANVTALLGADALGPPLANCFALVAQAGATQAQLEQVRIAVEAETPRLLGGAIVLIPRSLPGDRGADHYHGPIRQPPGRGGDQDDAAATVR